MVRKETYYKSIDQTNMTVGHMITISNYVTSDSKHVQHLAICNILFGPDLTNFTSVFVTIPPPNNCPDYYSCDFFILTY